MRNIRVSNRVIASQKWLMFNWIVSHVTDSPHGGTPVGMLPSIDHYPVQGINPFFLTAETIGSNENIFK